MIFKKEDIERMERSYRTVFINSLPGLKSLHLLGTVSLKGEHNLSMINSVFHIGANPSLLGLVVRPDGPEHDTLSNIRQTGEYTLNNVLPAWYKQAHQASARYPSGISEFEHCGLESHMEDNCLAPFVKSSTIRIHLQVKEIIPLTINNTTLVIGEIVSVYFQGPLVMEDGYIDHHAAGTLTIAGIDSYFEVKPLGRLAYAKPGIEPRDL